MVYIGGKKGKRITMASGKKVLWLNFWFMLLNRSNTASLINMAYTIYILIAGHTTDGQKLKHIKHMQWLLYIYIACDNLIKPVQTTSKHLSPMPITFDDMWIKYSFWQTEIEATSPPYSNIAPLPKHHTIAKKSIAIRSELYRCNTSADIWHTTGHTIHWKLK